MTPVLSQDLGGRQTPARDERLGRHQRRRRARKGWRRAALLFQTATSSVRQKIQLLAQSWWQEIGIATELRNIESAVFFSGDPASPDTLGKFYAINTEMFANGPDSPDPQNYLVVWTCAVGGESNIAGSANNWLRPNIERWCNSEYDTLFATYEATVDPQERAKLAVALNDMIVQNYVNLPLISRAHCFRPRQQPPRCSRQRLGEHPVEYSGVAPRTIAANCPSLGALQLSDIRPGAPSLGRFLPTAKCPGDMESPDQLHPLADRPVKIPNQPPPVRQRPAAVVGEAVVQPRHVLHPVHKPLQAVRGSSGRC